MKTWNYVAGAQDPFPMTGETGSAPSRESHFSQVVRYRQGPSRHTISSFAPTSYVTRPVGSIVVAQLQYDGESMGYSIPPIGPSIAEACGYGYQRSEYSWIDIRTMSATSYHVSAAAVR